MFLHLKALSTLRLAIPYLIKCDETLQYGFLHFSRKRRIFSKQVKYPFLCKKVNSELKYGAEILKSLQERTYKEKSKTSEC